jgi:hypothetical protein
MALTVARATPATAAVSQARVVALERHVAVEGREP